MELLNKLKYGALVGLGYINESEDQEFVQKKKRFELIQKNTKETIKHLQTMIKHFHAISSTLGFLNEDVSHMYGENLLTMEKIVQKLESDVLKNYEIELTETCIRPLSKFSADEVQRLLDARQRAKVSFDEKTSELHRTVEKPSSDPTKLPKLKEQQKKAKEEFERLNSEANQKLDELFEKSSSDFDPVMQGMSESTVHILESMANLLKPLSETIQEASLQRKTKKTLNDTVDLNKIGEVTNANLQSMESAVDNAASQKNNTTSTGSTNVSSSATTMTANAKLATAATTTTTTTTITTSDTATPSSSTTAIVGNGNSSTNIVTTKTVTEEFENGEWFYLDKQYEDFFLLLFILIICIYE